MDAKMSREEKVDAIREAQDKIFEALDLLRAVADGDEHARAYIIAPLEIVASDGHGWLTRDTNLDKWIEQIENEDEEETE